MAKQLRTAGVELKRPYQPTLHSLSSSIQSPQPDPDERSCRTVYTGPIFTVIHSTQPILPSHLLVIVATGMLCFRDARNGCYMEL